MSLVRSGFSYQCANSHVHAGACQIGSGAFGDWIWYFYLLVCFAPNFSMENTDGAKIPSYAVYKLWCNFVGPMIGWSSEEKSTEASTSEKSTLSKRQEKLRKRSEKGDSRVRTIRK